MKRTSFTDPTISSRAIERSPRKGNDQTEKTQSNNKTGAIQSARPSQPSRSIGESSSRSLFNWFSFGVQKNNGYAKPRISNNRSREGEKEETISEKPSSEIDSETLIAASNLLDFDSTYFKSFLADLAIPEDFFNQNGREAYSISLYDNITAYTENSNLLSQGKDKLEEFVKGTIFEWYQAVIAIENPTSNRTSIDSSNDTPESRVQETMIEESTSDLQTPISLFVSPHFPTVASCGEFVKASEGFNFDQRKKEFEKEGSSSLLADLKAAFAAIQEAITAEKIVLRRMHKMAYNLLPTYIEKLFNIRSQPPKKIDIFDLQGLITNIENIIEALRQASQSKNVPITSALLKDLENLKVDAIAIKDQLIKRKESAPTKKEPVVKEDSDDEQLPNIIVTPSSAPLKGILKKSNTNTLLAAPLDLEPTTSERVSRYFPNVANTEGFNNALEGFNFRQRWVIHLKTQTLQKWSQEFATFLALCDAVQHALESEGIQIKGNYKISKSSQEFRNSMLAFYQFIKASSEKSDKSPPIGEILVILGNVVNATNAFAEALENNSKYRVLTKSNAFPITNTFLTELEELSQKVRTQQVKLSKTRNLQAALVHLKQLEPTPEPQLSAQEPQLQVVKSKKQVRFIDQNFVGES